MLRRVGKSRATRYVLTSVDSRRSHIDENPARWKRALVPNGMHRLPRRLVQLYVGLVLFGASVGLMLEAELGVAPWDVFHQGLASHAPLSVGVITILVSAVVLLLWIPLRQRPGVGTLSNAVVVGLVMDVTLNLIPEVDQLGVRISLLLGGIVANGIATGLYIGAALGPGPRDGLMTGIAKRGPSLRLARTSIEIVVLATGWVLGGTVGVGTVLYALGIGPLAQIFIPRFSLEEVPVPRGAEQPAPAL